MSCFFEACFSYGCRFPLFMFSKMEAEIKNLFYVDLWLQSGLEKNLKVHKTFQTTLYCYSSSADFLDSRVQATLCTAVLAFGFVFLG